MAISDKLNYLIETKQLFKDRLNSLGAEITSSTTFRNYLTWLDTFYGEVSDKTDISINGVVGRTSQDTAILPSEYTQVDYIESHGTEYIDTGIKGNQDTKTEIKFEITNLDYDGNKSFVGARRNASSNHYGITVAPGTPTASLFSGYSASSINTSIRLSLNTEYEIVKDKNILYLDGTQILEQTYENFETPVNMYVFAMHQGGASQYSSIRLFNLKLYNDNILIRDFIPCYRNSDNEVGLYDLVNNVFYTNQGTGAFTYGSVVSIPNPDYPQPINNLSGDVAYKITTQNGEQTFNIPLKSKNLLDISKVERNVYYNYGTTGSVPTTATSDKRITLSPTNSIKVKPSTQYTLSFPSAFRYAIAEMENNYISLGDSGWKTNTAYTFTTSATTNYIGFNFSKTDNSTITDNDWNTFINSGIQLEENSTPTDYEPYYDIELCEINTYKDKVYSNNGRFYLYKETGNHTINTNDTVSPGASSTDGYVRCGWASNQEIAPSNFTKTLVVCNKFLGVPQNDNTNSLTGQHWYCSVSNTDNFKIMFRSGDITFTKTQFQEFLKNNNIIVYYLLNTPTTTEITQENYPSLYNALKQIQDYLTAYKINKEFILGYSSPEIEY